MNLATLTQPALDALTAERDRLRAALEGVEWADDCDGSPCCPDCCGFQGDPSRFTGHESDCALGLALGRPECKEGK